MTTFFSVIRYVPNAASQESVNVGVLIAGEDRLQVFPLEGWKRVRCFAGDAWKDVKKLVKDMEDSPEGFFGINGASSADVLQACLSSWTRVLTFSEVRVSVAPVEHLADSLRRHLLVDSQDESSVHQRRALLVSSLYTETVTAYRLRFDKRPMGLIQKHATVPGKTTRHKVDVGIVNGTVYAGAFALSFATSQQDKQWKDTDAVAFAVNDIIREADVPLTVVLDEPPQKSEPYVRARDLFATMGIETTNFDGIGAWAQKAVARVPDRVAIGH